MQNYNSYLNSLSAFYNDLANWGYYKNISSDEKNNYVEKLKNSARILQNEIKNLPPDMVREQVVEHIEKALAL